MDKIKKLEKRIADLETRQEFLITGLFGVTDLHRLESGNYALYMLGGGFRSEEAAALDVFYEWLHRKPPEDLRRDEVVAKFAELLPHHAECLETIARMHKEDHNFRLLCDVILQDSSEGHAD